METDNPMTFRETQHWHTFTAGAKAHIARRFWHARPDFRTGVVEAALRHWPGSLDPADRRQFVDHILHDPQFRKELRLGPVTWWLLGIAVKAILNALIDYWLLTQPPAAAYPFISNRRNQTHDDSIHQRSPGRHPHKRPGLPAHSTGLGRSGRPGRDR